MFSVLRAMMSSVRRFLVVVAAITLVGCSTELYTGVTEPEANEMLAALLQQGIDARKAAVGDGRFSVAVPNDSVLVALDVLREKGLPRAVRSSMGQVFAGSGIVSSPFEQRIRYVYALGEEVSRTLEEIDGVLTARVHIVMPENPQLGQELQPSSAAVFIKQRADIDLDYLVPQIRRLVSNSIQRVEYDQVSVTLVEARPTEAAPREDPGDLAEVLPGLRVAASSLPMLYAVAGVGLVVLVLSVVANVVLGALSLRRRGRRAQEHSRDEAATP